MIDTRRAKPVVFAAALVPAAMILWDLTHHGLGANPIETLEHETGVWALRMLAITLLVTPLRRITHVNELIKFRRMLGLFAFFYATVHLCIYIAVDMELDVGEIVRDIVKHPYVTVGMGSWLLLLPLALTSSKASIRWLGGVRWRRVHSLVYLAVIGGCLHYLWLVKKDTRRPIAYLVVFSVLLGYRVWYALQRGQAREGERA